MLGGAAARSDDAQAFMPQSPAAVQVTVTRVVRIVDPLPSAAGRDDLYFPGFIATARIAFVALLQPA